MAAERAKQAAVFEEEARKGRSLAGARAKQIAELETRVESAVSLAAERAKQVCAGVGRCSNTVVLCGRYCATHCSDGCTMVPSYLRVTLAVGVCTA